METIGYSWYVDIVVTHLSSNSEGKLVEDSGGPLGYIRLNEKNQLVGLSAKKPANETPVESLETRMFLDKAIEWITDIDPVCRTKEPMDEGRFADWGEDKSYRKSVINKDIVILKATDMEDWTKEYLRIEGTVKAIRYSWYE